MDCSRLGCCGGSGSIPSLVQWVKGSDVVSPVAWIQSLAWELSYTAGATIKFKKKCFFGFFFLFILIFIICKLVSEWYRTGELDLTPWLLSEENSFLKFQLPSLFFWLSGFPADQSTLVWAVTCFLFSPAHVAEYFQWSKSWFTCHGGTEPLDLKGMTVQTSGTTCKGIIRF